MLDRNMYKEVHKDLSILQIMAASHADVAIAENNHSAYVQAEIMHEKITQILTKHYPIFRCMLHEPFPEWPAHSMRPVFSDEEVNVIFSDGSYVDDTVDVPF